jgi:hypothetical protein
MKNKFDKIIELIRKDYEKPIQFDLIKKAKEYHNIILNNFDDKNDIKQLEDVIENIIKYAEFSIYDIEPEKTIELNKAYEQLGFIQGVFWTKGMFNE